MGSFNFRRFKNSLRRRRSNASDGRAAQTPMPPEDTSSSVANLSQSPTSPAELRTPQSRTEQSQPTRLTSPFTPDQAPSPTRPASSPLPQTIISRPKAGQSLWNRAYEALREDDAQLLGRYEKLLSRELAEHATAAAASQDIPGESDLDRAENYIKTDPDTRRAQLKKITDQGMHRADEKQTRYTIFGHEFVLKDQVAQAAQFIKAVKGLVDEAVKVSPEASLAWAGVCVLLPVLTSPSAVEEANRDGLSYVTSRIRYYVELEHLLWPENLKRQDLKEQFEHHIIELYQHILELQIKTVLRFYRTWLANMGRDVIHYDDWSGMVSKIKDVEQIIREESCMLNTIASRESLGDIHETAKGHYHSMQSLLSVTKKQLLVSMEHRDISSEQLAEQKRANQILENRPLDLPTVHEARYDSADVQGSSKCENGTRIRVQETITQWAREDSAEPLFWLVGPAGTGKSTVARTVADSFARSKQLVAGYFFKRGEQGRNDTSRLFPTLAMQLAEEIPSFRRCLQKSLQSLDKESVEKKGLEFQFNELLLLPMVDLDSTDESQLPRLIVIDALDECERPEHLPQVLALLSKLCTSTTVCLRVLLTSRPTPAIIDSFRDVCHRDLDLVKEHQDETRTDIATFLKQRFANIRTKWDIQEAWPEHQQLTRLISLSTTPSPLFIYAATLCRFIDDPDVREDPTDQLDLWLLQCDSNAPQLDQIYLPILHYVLFGSYNMLEKPKPLGESHRAELLHILGAVVLVANPLSCHAIASLLSIPTRRVTLRLRNLHAVLSVPRYPDTPVQLLHKSFSDFLLSQEGSEPSDYRVDAAETHFMLATKCIQRMQAGLKRDICDLRKPGISRDEIDQQDIDKHIPADLKYACLYWVYHLQRSGRAMHNDVITFLYKHFLHWLEALSLLGRLSDGAIALRTLREMIEHFAKMNSELGDFLKDATRVIASFGSIVEHAPLQTYSTLLLFSPVGSRVRQRFWEQRLPSLSTVQGVKSHWDSHQQTLEGHEDWVSSVAFLPDGQTLASGSDDKTVRLWDMATGAQKQMLEGHDGPVHSVAFLPDGQTLASGSSDKTVRLWDMATGAQKQMLKGHEDYVRSVAFSPNGQTLASGSDDKTVRLWDVATGAQKQTLEGHEGWVYSVAFSPNGQTLASGSYDKTVRLWDVATGAQKQMLEGHDGPVSSVAFSPDGQTLASGSWDKTVRLWDVATGAQKQTLEGHNDRVYSVAFLPDGQTLASGSWDKTVRLWDVATGAQKQMLEGHNDRVYSVAFSPDGQTLASGSWDKTVRLWDVATGVQKQTLEGHNDRVTSVAFLPDGQTLASGSWDKTVRLWDVATGAQKQTLEGFTQSLTFNPLPSTQLVTDFGIIDLLPGSLASEAPTPRESTAQLVIDRIGLSYNKTWIVRGNERIIWLPLEYRSTVSVVKDSMLCIGSTKGYVCWFTNLYW